MATSDVAGTTTTTAGPGAFGTDSPVDFLQSFGQVAGLPHHFLPSADPNGRAFARHMLQTPAVVMLRPGRVKYTNTDGLSAAIQSAINSSGGNISQADVDSVFQVSGGANGTFFDLANKYGFDQNELASLNLALKSKLYNTVNDYSANSVLGELRYFEFDPAYGDYSSVVATLINRVWARMYAYNPANPLDQLAFPGAGQYPDNPSNGGFVNFWADNASSVSESLSADVGQTAVASAINGLMDGVSQAQFILGQTAGGGAGLSRSDLIGNATSTIQNLLGSSSADSDSSSGIKAALGDAILGLNPLFPDVWKNSSFARTYDLTFRFFTPYGSPGAVFQNVMLPFLQLLAFVLPIMRNPGTYSEPFVFQVDCPGHFACDMGICTGFTFSRGGSDHLWTKEGLPRQIDVTMQVKDLYPTLMGSHNLTSLLCNVGLSTFLDNLAGINLFDSQKATSMFTKFDQLADYLATKTEQLPGRAETSLLNAFYSLPGAATVAALFRGTASTVSAAASGALQDVESGASNLAQQGYAYAKSKL